jgi:hypothetical protein
MAQHDYIIANQSGAATRADLNNGLAAIVSQNSGASEPSTTYAYQWWADTTTGLLKIRNAANNAWITVGTLAAANLGLLSLAGGTLTGALLLDDSGTAALPAIAFDGDPNTGIFRSAADTLNVATNGIENAEFGTTEVVFNDGGADIDFRIEGDTNANLFKIDAGLDEVQVANLNGGPLAGTRNRIINGDMRIDQRNNGASVTPTADVYTVDRWAVTLTQASKFSIQQSTTAPADFANSLLVTSTSAYSVLAGDTFLAYQHIEGFNSADLNWGTANAKTVTLSFLVRSSLTGTFGGALTNSATNRSYPFSYTISAANTWTTISVSIPGDTSGTWLTTNGKGISVRFGLGSGSTFSGTAGAWAAGNLVQPSGTVSVVGTNGATFYITGVQLEPGTVATPFERRSYGQELALCQRYYFGQTIDSQIPVAGQTVVRFNFPVSMRIAPTITNLVAGTLSSATVSVDGGSITTSGFYFQYATSAANGFVIGRFNVASAEL